jgi:hypothetical protein
MKNCPELIHIAAHLPKVVLRVAEGSTDKEVIYENDENYYIFCILFYSQEWGD